MAARYKSVAASHVSKEIGVVGPASLIVWRMGGRFMGFIGGRMGGGGSWGRTLFSRSMMRIGRFSDSSR